MRGTERGQREEQYTFLFPARGAESGVDCSDKSEKSMPAWGPSTEEVGTREKSKRRSNRTTNRGTRSLTNRRTGEEQREEPREEQAEEHGEKRRKKGTRLGNYWNCVFFLIG